MEFPKLQRLTTDYGRKYQTLEGKLYPSVTTIIAKTKDMSKLDSWRESVGNEVANHIMNNAAKIGSATHELIENYLNNNHTTYGTFYENQILFAKAHFANLRDKLDRIQNIKGVELQMYSDKLKVAGTSDCIAEYCGILSVIDYKTKRSKQNRDWMEDYFIQGAAYAMMYTEATGTPVELITILVSCETGESQEFIASVKDYKQKLIDRITKYYIQVEKTEYTYDST